jgi:hypothetical protein
MSATTNITEQVQAMRRTSRAAELAGPGRPRASRIPSGKVYRRKAKHATKGWS